MSTPKGGTPAIVMLTAAGAPFAVHEFHHEPGEKQYGAVAAAALGVEPERVFKTLLADLTVDGKVEQRQLSIDRAVGNQWWVTAGLKAGDQLIVEGGQKVRAGAAVQAQDASAQAATPPTPVKEG